MLRAARLGDEWALLSSTRPGRRRGAAAARRRSPPRGRARHRHRLDDRRAAPGGRRAAPDVVRPGRARAPRRIPVAAARRRARPPRAGPRAGRRGARRGHRAAVRRLLARPRRHRRGGARAGSRGWRRAASSCCTTTATRPIRASPRRSRSSASTAHRRRGCTSGAPDPRSFAMPRGLGRWVNNRSKGDRHMRIRKPSPSMAVASIALFVSLGGTSVAAVSYARNAGKVDGRDAVKSTATKSKAAGKLIATIASGRRQGQDPERAPGRRGPHADVRPLVRGRRQRAGRAGPDRRRRLGRAAHRHLQRPGGRRGRRGSDDRPELRQHLGRQHQHRQAGRRAATTARSGCSRTGPSRTCASTAPTRSSTTWSTRGRTC